MIGAARSHQGAPVGLKPGRCGRRRLSWAARAIITLSYVIDEPHCDAGRRAAAESLPLAHTTSTGGTAHRSRRHRRSSPVFVDTSSTPSLVALTLLIMAALRRRCGRYSFVLWFLLSFFLAYSQLSRIGCPPHFHTWCGLGANLGCRSETCCTRLAEYTGRKKIAKNSPSGHHRTTLSGYISSQLRHVSTIGKKTC